jgi:hypothetical protein
MRSHRKFTAITTSVILSLSFLTATTQSAKAASNQVSILSGQARAGDFLNREQFRLLRSGEVLRSRLKQFRDQEDINRWCCLSLC